MYFSSQEMGSICSAIFVQSIDNRSVARLKNSGYLTSFAAFAPLIRTSAAGCDFDITMLHSTGLGLPVERRRHPLSIVASVFEEPCCPLCGGAEYDIIYTARYPDDLNLSDLAEVYKSSSDHELLDQLVRCSSCTLAYLRPRLKDDVIVSSYEGGEDPVFIAQNPLRIRTFRRYFEKAARRLGLFPAQGRKVLDIGSAGGAFPYAARELGFDPVGIEPSRWMCEFSRREYNLDIRQGVLTSDTFERSSFDVVTMWDVLEHVPDPHKTLGDIHTILKTDGALVLTYPDFGSWVARLMGRKWPFLLSVHLTYYTPDTIRKQLEKAGFEVIRISPYWQTLELGYVVKRAAQYFPIFSLAAKLLKLMKLSNLPINYYMGQTLVLARKVSS